MRCDWCGGELIPEVVYTYKKPAFPADKKLTEVLAQAMRGHAFCSARCLQNYTRAAAPEEEPVNRAG